MPVKSFEYKRAIEQFDTLDLSTVELDDYGTVYKTKLTPKDTHIVITYVIPRSYSYESDR